MNEILSKIKGQLIVSCQALPDEPLHSSFIMGRMALAATQSGAGGIRANSVVDIAEIQKHTTLPIIGIIKKNFGDNPVYITATMVEVDALVAQNVEIIAMAATTDLRPNGLSLTDFFAAVRTKYPEQLFMADVSTLEEALIAQEIGFDIVAPTLLGYTINTQGRSIDGDDFAELKQILKHVSIPVIAEGGVTTPEIARRVLELGVFAVVVGGAITRPQQITSRFIKAMGLAK
ncbi:MAG: N-acetylmannosamine-6-phosphate 2-epimerase [Culicoidibacterales bacterium]